MYLHKTYNNNYNYNNNENYSNNNKMRYNKNMKFYFKKYTHFIVELPLNLLWQSLHTLTNFADPGSAIKLSEHVLQKISPQFRQ